ncbi:MAG TPA: glycosyltransferase [Methylocella sp.]|nr:glycosyltransferase [Methylocella sp.]
MWNFPFQKLSLARRKWLISRSRIFDRKWYQLEYPASSREDPIIHYLARGAEEGCRPHLLFDPEWYMAARGPRQRDPNPLIDYILEGAQQGIDPSPYFSAAYYSKAAGNLGGLTPLGHFVSFGLPRGLVPTPLFDREWYLANNPDVRSAGYDPFLHFVASGDRDCRSPGLLFDSAWYRMEIADEWHTGIEPMRHYMAKGAREGRSPSCFFDADYYARSHTKEGMTRETALASYATHGRLAWHSTHPILPPPASPSAFFEELPWERAPASPTGIESPFRIVIVDTGGASTGPSAGLRDALTTLAELKSLDVHWVTCAPVAPLPGVSILDLSRADLGINSPEIALDRILRALKFRDPRGVVCEASCTLLPLARRCKEISLAYHYFNGTETLSATAWAELLRGLAGYWPFPPPPVSVIVPNYNHARYLDERLASIANQRLKPLEVIFLDDGSTDGSLAIARAWQARSPVPFSIIANETNSGLPFQQWAKGIERAKGDLIWIAESDDSASPRFLEQVICAFRDPEVAIAYCDSDITGPQGEILASSYRFYTNSLSETKWLAGYVEPGQNEIIDALAIKNTIPNVSAVLFRRSVLNEAVVEAGSFRYCGDWAIYAACLQRGKIAYCPRALNKHRRISGNLTEEGEGEIRAVREALEIKRRIFSSTICGPRTFWKSLAQTIFEYEIRFRRGRTDLPALTENAEIADGVKDLRCLLEVQGRVFPSEADGIELFLCKLASSCPSLPSPGRKRIINKILHELRQFVKHEDRKI